MTSYQYLNIKTENNIAHIEINRPDKANSLNEELWQEIKNVFHQMDEQSDVRVVVLSGAGKHFCAGIDLQALAGLGAKIETTDTAKRSEKIRQLILNFQSTFNAIENCRKPVIAAIHSGCIGAGVDMISACDMRYASQDAFFVIKEIDIGMTADVGTLQRLPHLIGDGVMREMAYTGRKVLADEARQIGLVNAVYDDQSQMMENVMQVAATIAAKSPLAIRGTKEMILYTRDHPVDDALNYVATWNGGMLMSEDLTEAMMAQMEKRPPVFKD